MTKTPQLFGTQRNFKLKCMEAARAWADAHPSDPFAYGEMYNDLYRRIEKFGDANEVKNLSESIIKNRKERLNGHNG